MQISEKYKDKKVSVLGFGAEGQATFEYLKKHGITAAICDLLSDSEFAEKHPEYLDAQLHLGHDYIEAAAQYDVIFKTPGISPLEPGLVAAAAKGVVVTSQLQEFFDLCPCRIIGVTGTKGKGTTSTIIHDTLLAAGADVYFGGNIGNPAISFLDELNASSTVVLELSSFQLQVLRKSPQIAVLLNVTSEHLDYHMDTAEYREAKANIIRFQTSSDTATINADYTVPQEMALGGSGKKLYFSKEKAVNGCYVDSDDNIVLDYNGVHAVLAKASEMQLRGRHNLENITAASLAASVAGVPAETISKVIKNFVGLEHRLELVREVQGVRYYNDSFSTVPETAIAALNSFPEPIVLIAGGSSKNSDYTELGKQISGANIRALVLIGATANEIESALISGYTFPVIRDLTKMEDIVAAARDAATPGDIVLLSPACASKGLFQNYKDRGDQFKAAVQKL